MKNKVISFVLNDTLINEEVNLSLPLLDFIRKEKHLTGTKEVCKEGDCGACTVLLGTLVDDKINYKTITSCIYPIANCHGKHIVTIEGINKKELLLHQQAFLDENASQCGFCTPGFIMSFTCYLLNNNKYDVDSAINSLAGNICRCTGYHSIQRSIKTVIDELNKKQPANSIPNLIEKNVIPKYFESIQEKVTGIKSHLDDKGNKSKIFMGGGSDLFVQKADLLLESDAEYLAQHNLDYIREDNSVIRIGSGATFEGIKNSEIFQKHLPSLKKDIDLIASLPVRNAATIGGNLSNASPIGDLTIILLALNSQLILSNGEKERQLPLSDYYLDYKKLNKKTEEYIKEVHFDIPNKNTVFSFEKVSKRTYLDIASVNSAVLIEVVNNKIDKIEISAGGIAPVPTLLKNICYFLIGKEISLVIVEQALTIAQDEISPISDVRGSVDYKRLLLNQLIKAHFIKLFSSVIKEEELI